MAQIKTMHQAFLHELGDAYDAEQQLTQAMQEMLSMAQNPQVKQGLQQHIQETQQQIKNLEQVFKSVGAEPERVTCKGTAGIISEFKTGAREIKEQDLLDGFIVGGGCKGEHYEIATYTGLITKAQLMGHQEAAQLLQQNLQQEQRFLQQLEQLEQQLGQQLVSQRPELVGHKVLSSHPEGGQSGMGASR